ncbi:MULTISPECIES: hypothetical protein [Aurantimonas]
MTRSATRAWASLLPPSRPRQVCSKGAEPS